MRLAEQTPSESSLAGLAHHQHKIRNLASVALGRPERDFDLAVGSCHILTSFTDFLICDATELCAFDFSALIWS